MPKESFDITILGEEELKAYNDKKRTTKED